MSLASFQVKESSARAQLEEADDNSSNEEIFVSIEEQTLEESELSDEEVGAAPSSPENSEAEEDLGQETAPVLPEDFSAPDSLHFPERLPEKESAAPFGNESPGYASTETLPSMSSALPALPVANTLPPHEQLAVHFVEDGVDALSHDDLTQAEECFERALEVAPLQPFGYYFLGRLAFARGEHKTALVFLRKADALLVRGDQSWRGEAARLRGAVYEDMQDYRRASAAYRQSLQLTPTNLRAASALARLAGEEGDASAPLP